MKKFLTPMAAVGIVCGLALVPAGQAAKPAKTPKPPKGKGNLTISIGAAPNPVRFGETEQIFGTVGGNNHAGVTVTLEQDAYPFDHFKVVGSTKTGSSGSYLFNRHPGRDTRYRVSASGRGNPSAETGIVGVKFRVRMHVNDKTPKAGQILRFAGSVAPAVPFHPVVIQRLSGGHWKTVRITFAGTGSHNVSLYHTHLRVRHTGTYRARVKADLAHFTGTSKRLRLVTH